MSVKLDLNQFKHVKSDDKSTTLKHRDGHLLTLAHNVLSKPSQEQLKALSQIPKDNATDSQKQESQDQNQYGKTIMKAEGGPVQSNPKLEESKKQPPRADQCMNCGHPIKMYADPTEEVSQNDSAPIINPVDSVANTDYFKQASEAYPPAKEMSLEEFQKNRDYNEKVDAEKNKLTQTHSRFDPRANTAESPSPEDIQKQAESSVLSQATPDQFHATDTPPQPPANPQAAPDESQPTTSGTPKVPETPQQYQPKMASAQESHAVPSTLSSEDASWNNDLQNGHITPETYGSLFGKQDTLGKMGMMFGMLASGMGSGITGQPNMVMDMMNKEIERDLDAQKTSKVNAMNFHKLANEHAVNQAQIGNLNAQTALSKDELARMGMWRTALQNNWNTIQKIQDPVAKAQAIQAYGVMSKGIDNKLQNAESAISSQQAFMQGMLGGAQGASNEEAIQNKIRLMKMTPGMEAMAKDLEEKHYPGLPGQASAPLSADDKKELTSGIDFDQKLKRFTDWTKLHSGDISIADRKIGQTMAAELQGAYRQATHGGVYKEGEQNFISSIIDSTPTKFFNNVRVVPQLEALGKEHKYRMQNLVKSKGFPNYPDAMSQTPGASRQQEEVPQTQTVGGVKYQKVPGGWQKTK